MLCWLGVEIKLKLEKLAAHFKWPFLAELSELLFSVKAKVTETEKVPGGTGFSPVFRAQHGKNAGFTG